MAEQVAYLNDDFNYNMFLAKSVIANLETVADRQKTVKWVKKLSTCNKSIDELKLRNDFMYYLVLNVQNGELRAPFNDNPPPGPLPNLASLLPSAAGGVALDQAGQWVEKEATTGSDKPMLYQNSPDGGAFLASQPVPRCGAFCYMAVVSKTPK